MTDSPVVRAPLDPAEKPILDRLLQVRDGLELLRQDKSTYVKSQDIIGAYEEVIVQVHALDEKRKGKRTDDSRVDTVLDDCFQLISLAFMTIGKNHEAPAVYSAVSNAKRLLDHLKEAAFFYRKDVESISNRIEEFRDIVKRSRQSYDPHLSNLLEARVEACETIVNVLKEWLAPLRENKELCNTYERLVSILRTLSACNTKSKFPAAEVDSIKQELLDIEADLRQKNILKDDRSYAKRFEDHIKVFGTESSLHPSAERLVADLHTRCALWVHLIQEKQGKVEEKFQDVYQKLLGIRNHLDKLTLTQAWSLRETDLFQFQRQLDRIDESRVDGHFLDSEGKPSDLHAQRTLLYLLRKSYALIFQLLISSEAVSEALLPIYNQLNTLKRCLLEVKNAGGCASIRELYPYSLKLNSIDNMRVEGKFMVGNDIPDGQGAVTQLLEECFEIAYDLRNQAEDAETQERGDAGEGEKDDDAQTK
ncbi:hypothetical protein P152DRAFT_456860 [Eremomyces bilateralis CBS 781.70]|uniref:Uncharacterized protein n=1 Tax=Eremomyces bilateralis CBS 781.70 TaxID=1392243 RepID=A0A6G1G9K8_9PEZI|nr:uncharacterized protein P152DRAFT_456860 [Eremomyces bilateralis CBS 781.70]KAF1814590.1 hypothetical protein P152DRAFT_456860 [Eremomyces bilateralis CBS 781.70]